MWFINWQWRFVDRVNRPSLVLRMTRSYELSPDWVSQENCRGVSITRQWHRFLTSKYDPEGTLTLDLDPVNPNAISKAP